MKQAIVVRTDLKMGKGKLAAQVAHASLSAAESTQQRNLEWYNAWKRSGQAKVVLKVSSEEDLRGVLQRARGAGLPSVLIEDMGLTQVEPGTPTCVGIGPAPDPEIDAITGALKLL